MASSISSCVLFGSGVVAQEEEAVLEEVIVRGYKSALDRSLDIKRESNQIIEAVTADDIGKMPDQNVAESLQRLPGVQIDRRDGEGTKVRIRGLDQNLVLLNGGTLITGMEYFQLGEAKTEYGGSLEGIPSELLGGLEVIKTPTASTVEGAMGGVVNLKTRDPLTISDTLVAANAKVDYGSESQDPAPSGFLVLGDRWGDFAAIFSLTANQKNVHLDYYDVATRGVSEMTKPDGSGSYIAPSLPYIVDAQQERQRVGSSLSLSWDVNDVLNIGLDWFHSDLQVENVTYAIKHTFRDNNDNLNTPEEQANATFMATNLSADLLTATTGVIHSEGEVNAAGELFESTADNLVLKFRADPGERVRFSGDLTYSTSESEQRAGYSDSRFNQYNMTTWVGTDVSASGWQHQAPNSSAPEESVMFYDATGGGMPSIGFMDVAGGDGKAFSSADNLLFKSHWALGADVEQDTVALRGDMEIDVHDERLKTMRFGFRHSDEQVKLDELRYLSDFSRTQDAMSPNRYDANGVLTTATDFDPNVEPAEGLNNIGVREAVYYDLCGNGGIPAGKICDIDGDGEDDNRPFGPYGYFVDAGIGLKAWELETSNGTNMATALYGITGDVDPSGRWSRSPGYLPWETYTDNFDRYIELDDFFSNGSYNTSTLIIENAETIAKDPEAWRESITPHTPGGWFSVPFESWEIEQITDAFYGELDFEGSEIPYTLNVGVRAVNTRVNITSAEVDDPAATTWSIATDSWNSQGVLLSWGETTKSKSYWDILPSLNYTLDVTDDSKLRITAARVIARPSFQDLGKGFSKNFTRVDLESGETFYRFIGGSTGNPELDPFRAKQVDVAYEYYFGDLGLFSAGFFYKNVGSFIEGVSFEHVEQDGNPENEEGTSVADVNQPRNGEGGTISGFELQLQQAWDSGFGYSFNYTYADSETTSSSDSHQSYGLPGVSKNAFNLIGFYENDLMSARVAYAWRDEFVSPNNSQFGVANSTYSLTEIFGAYGQLDAQLTVDVTDHFSVNLEGLNLTAEDQDSYLGWKQLPFSYINQERRFVLGVTYRM